MVSKLFDTLGNPAAIKRAVEAAVPDCEQALTRKKALEADIAKVEKQRGRLIDAIADGTLTKEEVREKLGKLSEQESMLRDELDRLIGMLADVPTEGQLACFVERIGECVFVLDQYGEKHAGGNSISDWLDMTEADRRALVNAVFSLPQSGNRPSGVYVSVGGTRHATGRPFTFTIRGRLDFELVVSACAS